MYNQDLINLVGKNDPRFNSKCVWECLELELGPDWVKISVEGKARNCVRVGVSRAEDEAILDNAITALNTKYPNLNVAADNHSRGTLTDKGFLVSNKITAIDIASGRDVKTVELLIDPEESAISRLLNRVEFERRLTQLTAANYVVLPPVQTAVGIMVVAYIQR